MTAERSVADSKTSSHTCHNPVRIAIWAGFLYRETTPSLANTRRCYILSSLMLQSDDEEGLRNDSNNPTFQEVLETRLSRRELLGAGSILVTTTVLGCATAGAAARAMHPVPAPPSPSESKPLLAFRSVPTSTADAVVVPEGYTAKVLIAWGDPISLGPAFKQDASNTWQEQLQQWGMHNDGLAYFPIHGSEHGLIAQNHEYTDEMLLFPDGRQGWNEEKTNKSLAAHGVSVIEVRKHSGQWQVVRPSEYARRISGLTSIALAGPAAGDSRLVTRADPTGRLVLGTLNNCAIGHTPWGTFLTCEENFNVYFHKDGALTALEQRYGANAANYGYAWHTTHPRFHVDQEPNEPNRFGWVVEVDPFNEQSTPHKRTALGRFKHEGACVQEAQDGRVVVYSGDDEQFEYIYRYVSRVPWRQAFAQGIHPLDDGVLFVARFHADGHGEWLPLAPSNPVLAHWSLADILINTRGAADLVGATQMDRPEWIDALPRERMVLATLTNNSKRGAPGGANSDAVNPRSPNVYGHIVRWRYDTDFTDSVFKWDVFALAGDPANPAHGSTIVGDKYGSPDGLYVAPSGRVWIQTDMSSKTINSGPYAGFGNNQMLCTDPQTKETRRFLTGPVGCEVAGVRVTPDERTLFVGIQHPGEAATGANDAADPKRYSSWPDGPSGGRPRSSLLVITKDNGGKIGS